ncbi:hypothetical protein HDU97_008527 [Phlyctochytrium planicorne]|nr:hypothetical protein HDU97_008527 [Phlyctochytrium planicorne]
MVRRLDLLGIEDTWTNLCMCSQTVHFDFQTKFASARVKGLDFHPTNPWMLAALHDGHVFLWNHETKTILKDYPVSTKPVRAVKFIPSKPWFIVGSDDLMLRIYNYQDHTLITEFKAHDDYIRSIAVHPSKSIVLSAADDKTVKMWDWEQGWKLVRTFVGHEHYVMSVAIHPVDSEMFATGSLDKTVRIWRMDGTVGEVLVGHEKGVNDVEFVGGEKGYLLSGSDDLSIKVWDCRTKTLIRTLESAHAQNVSTILAHPTLPFMITGSEDGTVKVWDTNTFGLESTLQSGLDRVWTAAFNPKNQSLAFGCDQGAFSIQAAAPIAAGGSQSRL